MPNESFILVWKRIQHRFQMGSLKIQFNVHIEQRQRLRKKSTFAFGFAQCKRTFIGGDVHNYGETNKNIGNFQRWFRIKNYAVQMKSKGPFTLIYCECDNWKCQVTNLQEKPVNSLDVVFASALVLSAWKSPKLWIQSGCWFVFSSFSHINATGNLIEEAIVVYSSYSLLILAFKAKLNITLRPSPDVRD